MKYLFVSITDFKNKKITGAHKRFVELIKSFSERNEVSAIIFDFPAIRELKIDIYPIRQEQSKRLPSHISGMISLLKALKEYKKVLTYDAVISFGAPATICLGLAGYKNIVTLFREDIIGYQKSVFSSKLKIAYFSLQEKAAVLYSKMIIVQCEHDKKELIDRNKIAKQKTYVQGNNINTSWTTSEHNIQNHDGVKVLFIGNFSDVRKGHHILLPAIARLMDEGYEFDFYVLGDGKDYNFFYNKYCGYNSIHFLGHSDKVNYYLSTCDIEVVPSLIDSCPNTVLEGLNAGITVYGTNTGGIPELLLYQDYMFSPSEDSIYCFLKEKMEGEHYIIDGQNQKKLAERLRFDWGLAIENCIEKGIC